MWFKEKDMSNKMQETFKLENITSPIYTDDGFGEYEIVPAGYITFSSFCQYKKLKNLDRMIKYFLKRLPEIKNNDKVFECLNKIESLIDKCGEVKLDTNFEQTFDVAFPGIVKFIKKVGFGYGEIAKILYDAGINIRSDVNISDKVKHKYCVILHRLHDQKIWPFEIFV